MKTGKPGKRKQKQGKTGSRLKWPVCVASLACFTSTKPRQFDAHERQIGSVRIKEAKHMGHAPLLGMQAHCFCMCAAVHEA